MCQSFSIEQLANTFELHPKKAELYINQIKQISDLVPQQEEDSFSLSTTAQQYFKEVQEYDQNHQHLLNYTLCQKIRDLTTQENINFILQLTKRTKLKQQKEQQSFEELPRLIQLEKEAFAQKILNWLENKVILSDLSKVIIDRFTSSETHSEQNPDLRITCYESSHPQDINLIIKEKLNYLKKIELKELETKLEKELSSLTKLKDELDSITDEQLIKRIFKALVGYKDYYKITTNPEIIIIDFSQIQLPSQLEVSAEDNCLLLEFNNNCQITICQHEEEGQLITKLKQEPQDMELFSL